jgi:hypothetical protein
VLLSDTTSDPCTLLEITFLTLLDGSLHSSHREKKINKNEVEMFFFRTVGRLVTVNGSPGGVVDSQCDGMCFGSDIHPIYILNS